MVLERLSKTWFNLVHGGNIVYNQCWDGDRLAFSVAVMAQTVTSSVEVLDSTVTIDIQLPGLLGRIRAKAGELGGGYFRGRADEVILSPGLGDRAGLLGGLALAQDIVSAVKAP